MLRALKPIRMNGELYPVGAILPKKVVKSEGARLLRLKAVEELQAEAEEPEKPKTPKAEKTEEPKGGKGSKPVEGINPELQPGS